MVAAWLRLVTWPPRIWVVEKSAGRVGYIIVLSTKCTWVPTHPAVLDRYMVTWPAATRVSIPTTKGGREERPWERGWVSSIIVFGHGTAHAMHTCKGERAHPSVIIFLVNNIANNDIVMMMTKVMITKRNERIKTYVSCLFKSFFSNSLIMSCASRKEHVYIANTLSWITKQHILLYLKAKNSLNRENSLCGHHFSTQNIL